jgi:ferredoxin--NADP+ reductase/benzoate/toluate 1,2-dioxygenase reductase subunit
VEVLVKVVPGGLVSSLLRRTAPGEALEMAGPFGRFVIPPEAREGGRLLFVATGTGVSPFHCFALSYPDLEYRLLHGVRSLEDRYEHQTFPPDRYLSCVSRVEGGDYTGRVTAWLAAHPVPPDTRCYLCGNSDMIYDAVAVLREQGVPREHMFAEVYF